MRDAITALWSMIITIITGTEKFAKAYSAIGDVAENAATDFRDEESAHSKIRRAKLEAEYGEVLKSLEHQSS